MFGLLTPGGSQQLHNRVPKLDFSRFMDTTCLCRVYAGLKIVVGAKKFVPGIRVCMQPNNIKLSIHTSRHKPSRELCYQRRSRRTTGNFFYYVRQNLGMVEEWIYVMKRDRYRKILIHVSDPIYQLWQPLPLVPKEYLEALRFGSTVLSDCHLYLRVIFYGACTNKWHRAPVMLRRRYFLVSFISEMEITMVPMIGVVHNGKWFLKGLGLHLQVINEVYHPETDRYNSVYNGMIIGWRNPSISTNGNFYALDCKDGCRLRIYDVATDTWGNHIDSDFHLGSSRSLKALTLIQLKEKLCITRNNMSISMVNVSNVVNNRGTMSIICGILYGDGEY
ncbi:hypothetical protein MKW92_014922 [Papaver armeniacum]|nr:hypothetical protein MKW92_014922 [Papaver armeniacum]